MILSLFSIRNLLSQGKKLSDLPLRVTFYARVSTDYNEQLNSLDNQIMYFENYIKSISNWIYVSGYVDEGISGTSIKNRNNFIKMINDGKKGLFNLILTKEISRFSRNTIDSIHYTQELLLSGVGVYFLNDNINTFETDSELRLTIMASIAQDEIRKLSERVRFGYKRSMEKGIVAGNDNFYGYKKNKGKLEIVEKEAELIRLIFNEYSKEKMGTTKLGKYLYDEYNIVSKTGYCLAGTVISRIIRNPKYKGYYCAHKETTIDYHTKKRIRFKPDEWIIYKDNKSCPPIVSEELWDKCNKILDKNSKKHKTHTRTDMRYALSGKIKCLNDNASFIKGSYKNKNTGFENKYWACSNYRKYGKKTCNSPILYQHELLNIFKIILEKIINESSILENIYNFLYDLKDKTNISRKIKELEKKIKELKNTRLKLINMKIKNEIEASEYKELRDKYANELTIIEKKKQSILLSNDKEDLRTFIEKTHNIIYENDESIFRILSPIINTIFVEKLENNYKAMLYFNLNIQAYNENILSLNDFLLLFSNNEGLCSSDG